MKAFVTVLILSLLTGCATFKPSQKQVSLVLTKCPVLKQYSREELKVAAAEISAMPTNAQVTKLLADYSKIRQACRAIERRLKENSKK